MTNNESEWKTSLVAIINEQDQRFTKNKKSWNFWYYLSMYGAILLSALSALVLKSEIIVDVAVKNDMAALFATVAAILGTVMTTGNFEGRWRAARKARSSIQRIKVAIMKPEAKLQAISDELDKILEQYTIDVVGKDK